MKDISKLGEKVNNITTSAGVYLMKSSGGVVIYVGKAKNLKKRLSQYFLSNQPKDLKTEFMVSKVHDFDFIATQTETEALILECNLIKKFLPKYNILLKDDKRFPSVKVETGRHAFPRLTVVRRIDKRDKSEIFGPFAKINVWEMVRLLNKIFQLRDCSDNEFQNRVRPCIRYEMGHCKAPCVGKISNEDYFRIFDKAKKFLKGQKSEILDLLQDEMLFYSNEMKFEEAARLRDAINEIKTFEMKQTVESRTGNIDVISLIISDNQIKGTVVKIRSGNVEETEHLKLKISAEINSQITKEVALASLLGQYYFTGMIDFPEKVLIPHSPIEEDAEISSENANENTSEIDSFEEMKKAFEENGSTLVIGKNQKDIDLLEFARKNVAAAQDEKLLSSIAYELNLTKLPKRIECFDNSHLQGTNPVASRVCFIDGVPSKEDYRHYHIRSVDDGDDFAMMREVLLRRFTGEDPFPDLLIVDGGKGQLAQAVLILSELQITDVEIASLAKARSNKQTEERIFRPNRKNPIVLKPGTSVYKVLVHLRDEAHRFAITFHRQTRSKSNIK